MVKADLGYNVGSEEGGMHYGVVLDNNNDKSSKVVTIVTLRSLKEGESPLDIDGKFEVYLGCALLKTKINYVKHEISKYKARIAAGTAESPDFVINCSKVRKYERELRNLEGGTVAVASQVRTISKMRICEPTKSYHSLTGFQLPPEKMVQIEELICRLFLKRPVSEIESKAIGNMGLHIAK